MSTEGLTVIAILIALAVGVFIFLRIKRKKKEKELGTCPPGKDRTTAAGVCLPKVFATQIDRTDGGYVIAEDPITDENVKQMINDRVILGLSRMIRAATHYNPDWTRWAGTQPYQIIFVKKTATTIAGWPALMIGVGANAIKSAGTVINVYMDLTERGTPYIVLPQPDDWNVPGYWDYLEASAYHEGEHVIEWLNNKALFKSKIGAGDVHPHWPPVDETVAVGLIGGRKINSVAAGDKIELGDTSITPFWH
jgi:hypothetical protein